MKKIKIFGFIFLLMAGACNTSKITTSWKSEDARPENYHKILVLGLIREADRTIQEKMENHLVGDLQNLGYTAVSSLKEYGPKAFDKMDEETTISKLKNSGVDAVITIVLLDKQKERKYVPGGPRHAHYNLSYNRFWGYRTALYSRIYEPGYYVTNTKYFWESNFYDMSTQKLVYSVQTQSFEPVNAESLGHEYGQMIVKDMVKNNLLKKNDNTTAMEF